MSLYPGMGCEDQLRSQVNLLTEALRLERERNRAAIAELIDAGRAVVERWESPLWKDLPNTGEYIYALRDVIAKHTTTTKEGN